MASADIKTTWIGGNCPVQSEGTINGREYYFRARGDGWALHIAGESGYVFGPDAWVHEEDYPGGPYAAGWMSEEEAAAFILKAADKYVCSK